MAGGNSYNGKYFILVDDITAAGGWAGARDSSLVVSNYATNSPYISDGVGFAGTFDGDGFTLTVAVSTSVSATGGLFGYLTPAGTVKNLTVDGTVSVSGSRDAVGGVVGYNSGTIDNVTSSVTVSASSAYNVGGIAGFNDNYYMAGALGVIRNSTNTGAVTGYSKVGGIAGENAGLIASCANTSTGTVSSPISSKGGQGGIAGRNGNNNTAAETGVIRNCYNRATVGASNGSWNGGITGFQNALSSCVNTYNTGTIVGYAYRDHTAGQNEGTITNCYGLSGVSGPQGYDTTIVVSASELNGTTTVGATGQYILALLNGGNSYWAQTTGNYPTLVRNDTSTTTPATGAAVGTIVYLDGTTGPGGDGTSPATAFNDLDTAVTGAGIGGTVRVCGTVTIATATTRNDSVTFIRNTGFSGPLFNINASGNVRLTTATVDGNGSDTLFEVTAGNLQLRGSIVLKNAAVAVDVKAGGTVEVNKASVTGSTYSIKLSTATSSFIYNDFGGSSVSGNVYLASGAYIKAAAAIPGSVIVDSAVTASGTKIAEGTGYTLTATDLGKLSLAGSGTLVLDTGNNLIKIA